MFSLTAYMWVCAVMTALAAVTFIALFRVTAPYGMTFDTKWGPSIDNKTGWIIMESPAFIAMALLWIFSPRGGDVAPAVMASLFLLHYFQRSFIFPLMMKGKSRMAVIIPLMGAVFNIVNAYLIGGWIFFISPAGEYADTWLSSPLFILGTVVFFIGMAINLHSDHIIRHLRKPGDTRHYIPRGGMFRYVTSANYFGELTEWLGFAILTFSPGGVVFFIWTFANLAPRARSLHRRYLSEFGDEYARLNRKWLIPYIF